MRKVLCNKKRQCGLDRMPPVVETSNQYGSGLNDQSPDYIIPLSQSGKSGKIGKKPTKQIGNGKKRVSSPRKRRRATSTHKVSKKTKRKTSRKRKK